MTDKPKRRYHSKPCARCGGYGIVVIYEQSFTSHNGLSRAIGGAQAVRSDSSTDSLRSHAQYLHDRGVPMACPACRNLQEAAST